MPEYIIYTNCFGTFVFDPGFNIVDKILFDVEEGEKYYDLLIENKEIPPERKLIQKYNAKKPKKEQVPRIFEKLSELNIDHNKIRDINVRITRKKIKQSVNEDLLIINTINNIEEINKVFNTLSKRMREWYGIYFPELSENVADHEAFVRLCSTKTKEQLMKELKVKESLGADIKKEDLKPIVELCEKILDLFAQKKSLEDYLEKVMDRYCKNIKYVAGALIGARLLREVGSLKKLSRSTGSGIQMLGAEKALFRHLKNKKNKPPKHGHIINHQLVQNAKKQDRGRVARALADKISIAAKVDFFKGEFIGEKLIKELEKKFRK